MLLGKHPGGSLSYTELSTAVRITYLLVNLESKIEGCRCVVGGLQFHPQPYNYSVMNQSINKNGLAGNSNYGNVLYV